MAIFKAVIETRETNDPEIILNFVRGIILNPLYSDVSKDTKNKNGFVSRSLSVVEDKEKNYILVQIEFDSEENKIAYVEDPSTVSLFSMLGLFADDAGLNLKIEQSSNS
jgi:hypothetical protein